MSCLVVWFVLGLWLSFPCPALALEQPPSQQLDGWATQVDDGAAQSLGAQATGESVTLRVQSNGAAPYEVYVFAQDSQARWRKTLPAVDKVQDGSDWIVTIPGLDFQNNPRYRVYISTGYALFLAPLTPGMVGNETLVEVDAANSYPFQLCVPEAWGSFSDPFITLASTFPDGRSATVGKVQPGTLVPAGAYHVQVVCETYVDSYVLNKVNWSLTSAEDIIRFTDEDLVTVTAKPQLPDGIRLCSVGSNQRADVDYFSSVSRSVAWRPNQDGGFACRFTQGAFADIRIDYRLQAALGEQWIYRATSPFPNLSGDSCLEHNFSTLQAEIDQSVADLHAGQSIFMWGDFSVIDDLGHSWSIYNGNRNEVSGTVSMLDSDNAIVFSKSFVDGRITLPDDLVGDYLLRYEIAAGPIAISAASLPVHISAPVSPEITGTISLPNQQTAVADLVVKVGALDTNCSTEVVIKAGESCAPYCLTLPSADSSYRIKYEILGDAEEMVPWGYLGRTGITPFQGDAFRVSPGAQHDIVLVPRQAATDPIVFLLPGANPDMVSLNCAYPTLSGETAIGYSALWDVFLKVHIEPVAEGWLVGLSGLDFSRSELYNVAISTGHELHLSTVTADDQGHMITLSANATYSQLQIVLPDELNYDARVSLAHTDPSGAAWFCGDVQPGALIPAGAYNVQVYGGYSHAAFSLQQVGFTVSGVTSLLTFAADDLASLLITLPDGVWITAFGRLQDRGFPSVSGLSWTEIAPGLYRLVMNEGEYDSLQLSAWQDGWTYILHQSSVTVDGTLDFGTLELRARLSLPHEVFAPGATIGFGGQLIEVVDAAGRTWDINASGNLSSLGQLRLALSGAPALIIPIENGGARLPETPGTYTISYELPGSPIEVAPSEPQVITISSNGLPTELHLTVGQDAGGAPVLIDSNGTILVDMRYYGEIPGMNVVHNSAAGAFGLVSLNTELLCALGQTGVTVNGVPHSIPTPPILVEGKIYLPIGYILAHFGYRAIESEDGIWLLQTEQVLDLDGDQTFGVGDLSALAFAYVNRSADEGYRPKFDLRSDGVIDLYDLVFLARWLADAN